MSFPRLLPTTVAVVLLPLVVAHGQSAAVTRGADALTEALVRRHIGVIADDSMLGRDTPSRGLELTAQYIADTFKRLGLRPGGDNGSFLQRYQILRQKIDGEKSSVRLQYGDAVATASFVKDARYVSGPRPGRAVSAPAVLIAGAVDSSAIARANIAARIVLLVGDFARPSLAQQNAMVALLLARQPAAVIVVSNREQRLFDQVVRRQFIEQTSIAYGSADGDASPVAIEVHERAIGHVLSVAGVDLDALRASPRPVVRPVPELQVTATVGDLPGDGASAPNTVGILEGTDPVLKHEYIVFSAHMDHVGVNGASAKDSIWNGADDDASGTTGVLALAEAFAKARPRRSIIFLTVSGEEKGLWGSEIFAAHPPVPIRQIVANLNLDMIGRNWKDTIVVIGKEHSDLGATLHRVNAAHPELGMRAIDDPWPQENFYGRSDHFNFAQRGVPVLFFFNGTHADYHQPSDSPDKIDAEKEARILRLVYHIGQDVGNAAVRPQWNPESYRKIVKP